MRRALLALFAAGALAAGAALGPNASAATPYDPLAYGFQGEGGLLEQDLDARDGRVAPTSAQRAAVAALGARAEWNPLGSPQVLTRLPLALPALLLTGLAVALVRGRRRA